MRTPRAEGHTSVEVFYHMSEALWVAENLPGQKKRPPAVT
jgi:hypothetical protein